MKRIPYPIPAEYRVQLTQLGTEARRLGAKAVERVPHNPVDVEAYEDASRLLEMYEKSIRRQLGVAA